MFRKNGERYSVYLPRDVAKMVGITDKSHALTFRLKGTREYGFIIMPKKEDGVPAARMRRSVNGMWYFTPDEPNVYVIAATMRLSLRTKRTVELREMKTQDGLPYYLFKKIK